VILKAISLELLVGGFRPFAVFFFTLFSFFSFFLFFSLMALTIWPCSVHGFLQRNYGEAGLRQLRVRESQKKRKKKKKANKKTTFLTTFFTHQLSVALLPPTTLSGEARKG
jgi:hypothetical protein